MSLLSFVEGNEKFRKIYFQKHEVELMQLVKEGQKPKALFIGCSDSRVIPDMITGSSPGDLFVVRNVGNFVPPYKPDHDFHGTAAGIEYAVNVLQVSEIIVCGHSYCGACESLYQELNDAGLVHVQKWLELGVHAKEMALSMRGAWSTQEELVRLTERLSIITQLENLMSYPYIREKLDAGRLFVHGWYYKIENGEIEYFDPSDYAFHPLKI